MDPVIALLCAALVAAATPQSGDTPARTPGGDAPATRQGSSPSEPTPAPRDPAPVPGRGAVPEGAPGPSHQFDAPPGPFQLRLAVVPLVSYGSNVGLQLGAAFFFYRTPEQGGARRDWLALAGSWATNGPRSVEAKGERFSLFGTKLRAFFQAKYASDDLSPYWGEGAQLAPGDTPGSGTPPPAYRYRSVGPWLSLVLRHRLGDSGGPWWAGGRARFRQVDVFFPGDALRAAAPPGANGGTLTILYATVMRDTRDDETSPSRGTLADVSLFGSPPAVISDHGLGGVNVGLRGYRALAPGIVLAARAIYELKVGDVPFYERTELEGLNYGEGLGGPGTLRGVARARLAGEEKMLGNLELRATLVTLHSRGRPLELGVSAGADAGRARQRGYSPKAAAGVFGGLRAIWDRALVIRLEVGHAGQGGQAVYLAFDETF